MEIHYKGFTAKIIFSPNTDTFYGEVLNSLAIIAFLAQDPREAVEILHGAVDRYLLEQGSES